MKQTKNSIKYNFEDFTTKHYEEIIISLKETHKFSKYTSFNKEENFVLNRHDVDFSVENALVLAEIEAKHNVQSTYFFLIHGEFYSFLEPQNIDLIQKIYNLGHDVGLHFDAHFYGIENEDALNEKIQFEKDIIEFYIGNTVGAFSFHNTTAFTMNCKEWQYGGLINTYANYFQENVAYCSDSNGYWRFNRMYDFVKSNNNKPLQLLTHPVWWAKEILSPKQKISDCIDKRANDNKSEYSSILESFGRENIDW